MYYIKEYSRYGSDYTPVADSPGALLRRARRKFESVRRIHRSVRRAFLSGCGLVLGQFPFSFVGSEALHTSTAILGGVLVLVAGGMLAFHYGTGEGMPDLADAEEAYEQASEIYTKYILEVADDVG